MSQSVTGPSRDTDGMQTTPSPAQAVAGVSRGAAWVGTEGNEGASLLQNGLTSWIETNNASSARFRGMAWARWIAVVEG